METNFIFVCLLPNYMDDVAAIVANKLDMFTISVEELVQQEFGDEINLSAMLKNKEGKLKLEQCETRVAKKVQSFENSIVCLALDSMLNEANLQSILGAGTIVYLQVSPTCFEKRCKESGDYVDEGLNAVAFSEKDKYWVEKSEIVLNCSRYKISKAGAKLTKICTKFLSKQRENE